MTRKIKAQDVKPGMKVEFTREGWTSSGIVDSVWTQGTQTWFYSQPSNARRYLSSNQEVTVLAEPQSPEPTAFGACVEVAGKKYVRVDEHEPAWVSNDDHKWDYWADILDAGPVTVINPAPFASTEPRAPRVWDRWADVPDRVTVRVSSNALPYRKVGDRIEYRLGGSWVPAFSDEHDLNEFSPFTEVPISPSS